MQADTWRPPQHRGLNSATVHPEVEAMWPAAGTLIDFATSHLPVDVSETDQDNDWLQIVWLPARTTDDLFAIMNLGLLGLHADAAALLRVMADHVIAFAWLSADEDPPARYNAWLRAGLEQARWQYEHVEDLGGEFGRPPPPPAFVDASVPWLKTAAAAQACDDYWEPFLVGAMQRGTINSFEGIYATVFRQACNYVHPTPVGGFDYLNRDTKGRVRGLTSPPPRTGVYAEAVNLQLLAMYVLTVRFAEDAIDAVRRLWNVVMRAQADFYEHVGEHGSGDPSP